MYLSAHQSLLLSRVMLALAEAHEEAAVRERVGRLMLDLLDAQYYASYVWNDDGRRFEHRVCLNMDPGNLERYEAYYQFHDPITLQLQRHRSAVRVVEVMPQQDLVRTEFFNDFLARDGLHWGVNVFAWSGLRNIGDMRIWRDRRRDNFTAQDVQLLDLVRPAFTAALQRCRAAGRGEAAGAGGAAAPAPADAAGHELLEGLSPRERQIAELVARGLPDKDIARRLGISFTTVRTHLGHTFRKLGVDGRVGLASRLR
jgi:DNA-binding CsgD family transcriptional regulator